MLKKMSMVLTVLSLMFILSGCAEEPKSDADILYEIKASIEIDLSNITGDITIPSIDNEDVTVTWTSSKPQYLDIDGTVNRPTFQQGNQLITLTLVLELNDAIVTKYFDLTVVKLDNTLVIELNTDYTDDLVMDFTYEGKSFINDAIGEVTLLRCVDGDTAIFTEGSNSFSVRFLGIDTPESTYKFDPWGKAASQFTCNKLENATTIVLEWDAGAETRTDGNDRYLAWVWYDGRLLNLELVEEALTGSKGVSGLKYEYIFFQAEFKTQDTDLRIWGEDDPDYDYSLEGIQITIEELVTNPELYIGKKVVIIGIVSRTLGGHPYIQDGLFGVYLFKGYAFTTKLAEGNEIILSGLTPTYHPNIDEGGLQLTGFTRENIEVLSVGNEVIPVDKLITEISIQDIGSLLKIYDLTVTSIYVKLEVQGNVLPTIEPDLNISIGEQWFDESIDTLYTAVTEDTWDGATAEILLVDQPLNPEDGTRWFNKNTDELFIYSFESFTVTVEDALGNIIIIRRDKSANDDITPDLFVVGTKFDIVAPLGRYDSVLQLMITNLDDVTYK